MADEYVYLEAPLVPFLGGPADGLALPVARPLPLEAFWSPGPPARVTLPDAPCGRLPGSVRYLRAGTVSNPVYVCEELDPVALTVARKELSCPQLP